MVAPVWSTLGIRVLEMVVSVVVHVVITGEAAAVAATQAAVVLGMGQQMAGAADPITQGQALWPAFPKQEMGKFVLPITRNLLHAIRL